jgi:hypothetical protein
MPEGKLPDKRQLLEGHCMMTHPPFADLLMARAIKNAVSQELWRLEAEG